MRNPKLDRVVKLHDKLAENLNNDWVILGEKISEGILDAPEHADANFTDAQKAAIIAACRETYYAASTIARAYAYQAAKAIIEAESR